MKWHSLNSREWRAAVALLTTLAIIVAIMALSKNQNRPQNNTVDTIGSVATNSEDSLKTGDTKIPPRQSKATKQTKTKSRPRPKKSPLDTPVQQL